jgi:hypothetical protein
MKLIFADGSFFILIYFQIFTIVNRAKMAFDSALLFNDDPGGLFDGLGSNTTHFERKSWLLFKNHNFFSQQTSKRKRKIRQLTNFCVVPQSMQKQQQTKQPMKKNVVDAKSAADRSEVSVNFASLF